jgi:hypothetical protein
LEKHTMHEQVAKRSASGPESLSTDLGQDQLAAWNETAQVYPENVSVAELVAARVLATPDELAVVTDGETLSYREVEAHASQLAHYLRSLGTGPERPVVLCGTFSSLDRRRTRCSENRSGVRPARSNLAVGSPALHVKGLRSRFGGHQTEHGCTFTGKPIAAFLLKTIPKARGKP